MFEISGILFNHLNLLCGDKLNPLYGVSIETDPYKQIESSTPFILIEENMSRLITNPQGYVYEYLHLIDLTCVVSAQNITRDKYFKKVTGIAEQVIQALGGLNDSGYRIIPKEIIPGEVIIGGMKCSAVKISIEVKTLFMEN